MTVNVPAIRALLAEARAQIEECERLLVQIEAEQENAARYECAGCVELLIAPHYGDCLVCDGVFCQRCWYDHSAMACLRAKRREMSVEG